MTIAMKFCGLKTPADIAAAASAGARYVGFVFFPKSPRYVSPETAAPLAVSVPVGIAKVGLVVDMEDAALEALLDAVPLDVLQLHGKESPERVSEIKARFGLPVIKAIGISDASDLPAIDRYAAMADQLLVDAKPPKGADRPGGNAAAFDWSLIADYDWPKPWLLAGGLTAQNVAHAITQTGAKQVDVSSGIEAAPGTKDATMMQDFAKAVGKAVSTTKV